MQHFIPYQSSLAYRNKGLDCYQFNSQIKLIFLLFQQIICLNGCYVCIFTGNNAFKLIVYTFIIIGDQDQQIVTNINTNILRERNGLHHYEECHIQNFLVNFSSRQNTNVTSALYQFTTNPKKCFPQFWPEDSKWRHSNILIKMSLWKHSDWQ